MNRLERFMQNKDRINKIILTLLILFFLGLIIDFMFYEEVSIFIYICFFILLLVVFLVWQRRKSNEPTEAMVKFEEEHKNFSKLYVNLTDRPFYDDKLILEIDGKEPVIGRDQYGIYIYIIDKELEYVSRENFTDMRDYLEEYLEKGEELVEDKRKIYDPFSTRIKIDKLGLEKRLDRKFQTYRPTINLVYNFKRPNSRYALRYMKDIDKFAINYFIR